LERDRANNKQKPKRPSPFHPPGNLVDGFTDFDSLQTRITVPPSPFPPQHRCTIIYREAIPYTSVGYTQSYAFRGNGPFDPNATGTGSQPVGYDELSTFYNKYFVIGARIIITFINNSVVPIQMALVAVNSTSTITSYDDAMLYPGRKTKMFDGYTRGGNSYGTLTATQRSLSVLGRSYDDQFSADVTANPSSQWYFMILFQTADQATSLSGELQVQIYYDAMFFSRKFVGLS
jgi:hypothetical protein